MSFGTALFPAPSTLCSALAASAVPARVDSTLAMAPLTLNLSRSPMWLLQYAGLTRIRRQARLLRAPAPNSSRDGGVADAHDVALVDEHDLVCAGAQLEEAFARIVHAIVEARALDGGCLRERPVDHRAVHHRDAAGQRLAVRARHLARVPVVEPDDRTLVVEEHALGRVALDHQKIGFLVHH